MKCFIKDCWQNKYSKLSQIFPVLNCPGAKLSLCQIVHFYYLGAKLSAFIILVPNCPLYYLGAKLSGAKLSYNQNQVPYFSFQTYTSPK